MYYSRVLYGPRTALITCEQMSTFKTKPCEYFCGKKNKMLPTWEAAQAEGEKNLHDIVQMSNKTAEVKNFKKLHGASLQVKSADKLKKFEVWKFEDFQKVQRRDCSPQVPRLVLGSSETEKGSAVIPLKQTAQDCSPATSPPSFFFFLSLGPDEPARDFIL